MDEDKDTRPLLSYEEVIEIIDECISRDEPIARDERIARMEKAAARMEADRRSTFCILRRHIRDHRHRRYLESEEKQADILQSVRWRTPGRYSGIASRRKGRTLPAAKRHSDRADEPACNGS